MPRFENDPTKVVASFEVLPKDSYEFVIGEPKTFMRKNKKDQDSYGIGYPLVVAEGHPLAGKKSRQNCYQQSEGAQIMAKQWLMAALGYGKGRAEEQRFDEEYAGKDWAFDTDTGAIGDMWRQVVGQRVVGDYDTEVGENGEEQQKVLGWRPIGS